MGLRYFWILLFFVLFFSGDGLCANTNSGKDISIDNLLAQATQYLNTYPEKSEESLVKLKELQSKFSARQRDNFYFISAVSLGFNGKHKERVDLVQSVIETVTEPEFRVKFLYQLSDGYTNLGDYENALSALNQSIILLPNVTLVGTKITILQSAVTLLNSLHAYDDALIYVDRMALLEVEPGRSRATCYSLANRIETEFLRGNSRHARTLVASATDACDSNNRKSITRIVKALTTIDQIDSGSYVQGIALGLPLLLEFSKVNQTSDYVTQLEEAIARAYLKNADLQLAERYGLQAYQHAQNSKVLQMMEKTSETMAKIKRAQGNMVSALDYYDINLALKKKVLDDQLHKNLAYQRVKFDTQDKANQLNLLEQKNKILSTEKQLEQKNNQNLLMLIALGAILMVVLLAWTLKIIRQKNLFRLSSQLDALTQLSNRGHFVACGMQQFEKTQGDISVILFDMDHFKNINDSFGHASGDWVLKAVSVCVKALLPKAEMLGRLGGEEFAIYLPKFDTHQALAVAESCRAAIAAIDSLPSGFAFPISASFGVASRGMRELKEFEDTLAAADKALYFSKTEGRNRVSLYQ